MLRLTTLICTYFLLSGCAILESTPFIGTDEITRSIGLNTTKLNDAHARATNGVILQNILRARDRWPMHYTTLSGIQSQPQVKLSLGVELKPIGLGNPPTPFGESGVTGSQDSTSASSYTVNPFEQRDNPLSAIKPELFARYWNAGWPKDVLLLVLAKSITVDDTYVENRADEASRKEYWAAISLLFEKRQCEALRKKNLESVDQNLSECANAATATGANDCEKGRTSDKSHFIDGCRIAFIKKTKIKDDADCPIIERFDRLTVLSNRDKGENGLLGQIEKLRTLYGGKVHIRHNPISNYGDVFEIRLCKALKVDAGYEFIRVPEGKSGLAKLADAQPAPTAQNSPTKWTGVKIQLRSIDEALYFLGEWKREFTDDANSSNPELGEAVLQSSGCILKDDRGLPLMESDGHPLIALTTLLSIYDRDILSTIVRNAAGEFAVTVDHAGKIYFAAKKRDGKENGDCEIDRTGTIFSLLSQIYISSQSPEFLKGPNSGRIQIQ